MTTCIHPPALVEPLLLRALDGDVDAATAAHLATSRKPYLQLN